ncbi:hypothetical protein PIB30_059369 [Stylosanthes scabra]|uniref:Uncharacterized protein n=1 Tax=Stylosanthes scabra TaxID=79078 RepID=A0ABU6ZIY3_9FABA|nr:hypothetical protein [Stylosanthes scabra]
MGTEVALGCSNGAVELRMYVLSLESRYGLELIKEIDSGLSESTLLRRFPFQIFSKSFESTQTDPESIPLWTEMKRI